MAIKIAILEADLVVLTSKTFWSHRAEILALGTNSVKILRVNECRFCTFGDIVASRRCDTLTKNELLCTKNKGLGGGSLGLNEINIK